MPTSFVVGLVVLVQIMSQGIETRAGSGSNASSAYQNTGGSRSGTIQGVWQAVEVTMPGPSPMKVKPQPNLTFFAAAHYSRTQVSSERPVPALAEPAQATADELRATWGPFVGEAGTYEVSGDRITMRPIVAKNPAVIGTTLVYSFTIDGDTLRVTAISDRNGPIRNPVSVVLTRIE